MAKMSAVIGTVAYQMLMSTLRMEIRWQAEAN